jgi:hypothetical protein
MSRIAKNTAKLNAAQLGNKLQLSLTAIAANPAPFTGATAVLALGQTKYDALIASDTLVATLKMQMAQAREARRQAIADTIKYYEESLMHYVNGIAMGEASIILLAAMDVVGVPTPPPTMLKVEGVTLDAGEADGSAFADWDAEGGARWYELETSPDPMSPASWVAYKNVATVGLLLTGLPSLQKRWVRVRAVNSVNAGAWSDPACCTIP